MKLFIILGNQLFPKKYFLKYKKDHHFFMAEDYKLCTFQKHHKQKILFFLSSMRSFADELKDNGYNLSYYSINEKYFKDSYDKKIQNILKQKKIAEVTSYEIEDKFFENYLNNFFKKHNIKWNIVQSPMFLNSRESFKEYLKKTKKPFMANFYKSVRINSNILITKDKKPIGDKWSFDAENRKKIPKDTPIPKFPTIKLSNHSKELLPFIKENFSSHPGNIDNFWFATSHKDANKILDFFIKNKLLLFGDYEDAVSQDNNILFHSAISPYLNNGLLTPDDVVNKILKASKINKIPMNSLEGFIRQVIGWREFMRGIYQNYNTELENSNFFKHKRLLKSSWYKGTTNIPPLDYAIKNAEMNGWSHHIERLMILSNLMNLCEIHPKQVYNWFMEMFVDSSDWVMSPNVYGMGLFSDGGIFSTKPYICGSSYILKMMDFKRGEWCDVMDGLYWRFINKNRNFFKKNPRLSMMVSTFDKMNSERKKMILSKANEFIKNNTK